MVYPIKIAVNVMSVFENAECESDADPRVCVFTYHPVAFAFIALAVSGLRPMKEFGPRRGSVIVVLVLVESVTASVALSRPVIRRLAKSMTWGSGALRGSPL